MKRAILGGLVLFLMLLLMPPPASMAAGFPERAVTYSVPWPPGGQSDVEARRQQPLLEKILGVKVVVQYKPGGGGSLGWSELLKQKPDGYFICGINIPHIVLQPLARGDAGYETEQLWPVSLFQATPIGLAVMKDSKFKTLEDLIAFAKKNPGAITVGGSGTWSGHHIAHLEFQKLTGVTMTYVPHKGAAPQVAAFLGGHVQAIWGNSNDLVTHKDKIRVLAFGTKERFRLFSDAPTFSEKGFKLFASIDRGVAVPPNTPADRIKVLESAFMKITGDPKVQEQMLRDGFNTLQMGAEECKKYIAEKIETYRPIVKEFKK